MIRWTGLAPCEFQFPFPGSLTSTFLGVGSPWQRRSRGRAGRRGRFPKPANPATSAFYIWDPGTNLKRAGTKRVLNEEDLGGEGVEDVLDVEVYERGHVLAVWADLGSSQFKHNHFA